MPRSERGRVRGNCLQGIALPFLAQAPAAGGAPAAGQAAPASGGRWGAGLGERSKAVREALRTVTGAWAGAGGVSGRKRASWRWAAHAGRSLAGAGFGGRWIGFGKSFGLWSTRKASLALISGPASVFSWRGVLGGAPLKS